jgi:AraC-like DNA-binding protein
MEQGQTFDGLLDEVRCERALQAVADTAASLPEVAESLGFAEVSTFYRAFRRWTGLPPVRWRKHKAIQSDRHLDNQETLPDQR